MPKSIPVLASSKVPLVWPADMVMPFSFKYFIASLAPSISGAKATILIVF